MAFKTYSFIFKLSFFFVLFFVFIQPITYTCKNHFDGKQGVMGRLKRGGLPEKESKGLGLADDVDGVHGYTKWILAVEDSRPSLPIKR